MKMKKVICSLLSLLVVVAMISACAPKATETPVATEAPAATEAATQVYPEAPEFIQIGGSVPLTGKYGTLGEQVSNGYTIAVDDINKDGGVYVAEYGKKIPLKLTVIDDASDPTKAQTNEESLFSNEQVVAYLGGAGSDMHAATIPIAEKNKTPYLGVSFALWSIHQQGYKYLFSPFPKSVNQTVDVYKILNELIPNKEDRPTKVAIFEEKTDWGIEEAGMWEGNAHTFGYEVVYRGQYAPKTADYSDMILAAKAAGADALFCLPNAGDGTAMIKQMKELGWTPKFTLMIRAPEGLTWGDTLGKDGDYVTIFPGWHHAATYPGDAELNTEYNAKFSRDADLLSGPAYACVQILADAIERAGTLDRDAIRDAIAATDMDTVIGNVTFNEDGTGNVGDPLIQWIDGKMQLVYPLDMASAKFVYPAPAFEER